MKSVKILCEISVRHGDIKLRHVPDLSTYLWDKEPDSESLIFGIPAGPRPAEETVAILANLAQWVRDCFCKEVDIMLGESAKPKKKE